MDTPFALRPARKDEAELLTELALRSKGYWNYDAVFLAACRSALTVTADFIASHPVVVLEEAGRVLGFYGLIVGAKDGILDYLFVEPEAIGHGYGRQLWNHACQMARQLGMRSLYLASDPHAEPFYKAMGAVRVGEVASEVQVGRMNPFLRYSLS